MAVIGATATGKNAWIISHPLYATYAPVWRKQQDCYAGERAIKAASIRYLPMPSGMAATVDIYPSQYAYQDSEDAPLASLPPRYFDYMRRATFPSLLEEGVSAMMGMVLSDAGTVEVPASLEYLQDAATPDGESIVSVLRETLRRQLVEGRVLWLWVVNPLANQLQLKEYLAQDILDWHVDAAGNLRSVVLDESTMVYKAGTGWEFEERYRVASLDAADGYYTMQVEDMQSFDFDYPPQTDGLIYPVLRGKKANEFPGVIFNSVDCKADPSTPVMAPVAEAALKAYMNSADYQHSLHLTAQPTPIGYGFKDDGAGIQLGSATILTLDHPDSKADIKFLEISGTGLDMLRQSIEDYKADARRSTELIESGSESGVALNTRLSIKMASLQNVARNLIFGMTKLLNVAARWQGADENKVSVMVNTEFRKDSLTMQEIVQMATLVTQGLMTKDDFFYNLKAAKRTQYEEYDDWDLAFEKYGFAGTVVAMPGDEEGEECEEGKDNSDEDEDDDEEGDDSEE